MKILTIFVGFTAMSFFDCGGAKSANSNVKPDIAALSSPSAAGQNRMEQNKSETG